MEMFPPLTEFYEAVVDDPRIGASHIAIYMALLQEWNIHGGVKLLNIERLNIMKLAKIKARYTYNRCMTQLHEYGYINYMPAKSQFICSTVILRIKSK